jgi:hypothetical protein
VADVPGRCEPGTGEINYPGIAQALHDVGYQGTVGLEAWASGDSELALERFRAAFTKTGSVNQSSVVLIGRFRAIDEIPSADIRHWSLRPRQVLRLWVLR